MKWLELHRVPERESKRGGRSAELLLLAASLLCLGNARFNVRFRFFKPGLFSAGLFSPRLFWAPAFLGLGFFGPGLFWAQAFLGPGFFGPGLFWPRLF